MDDEVLAAIERYELAFDGMPNISLVTLNLGDPLIKERVIGAIDNAIATATPLTDAGIGITVPDGAVL